MKKNWLYGFTLMAVMLVCSVQFDPVQTLAGMVPEPVYDHSIVTNADGPKSKPKPYAIDNIPESTLATGRDYGPGAGPPVFARHFNANVKPCNWANPPVAKPLKIPIAI